MLDIEQVERALVVTAHPDDVDFGAAGTVAMLTDAGVEVSYLVVTDGQAGGFDRDLPRVDIPTVRRREQRAAAAVLGVQDVTFLGLVDGEVQYDLDLCRAISRRIREVRPQLVLTSTPERNYRRIGISHPDHRRTGEACLDAVYPFARNPFAFPELLEQEGLEPWIVEEVWLLGHPEVRHTVDVTDTFDRKLEAILCHESQIEDPDEMRARLPVWFGGLARHAGLEEGRYAELFGVVEIAR